jgi:hypothetical protein
MEIAFPAPPSVPAAAAAPAGPAPLARTPAPPAAPGPPALARSPARDLARMGTTLARAPAAASGGGDGGAVDSVLRQMRLENEHLGLVDGIDPLF